MKKGIKLAKSNINKNFKFNFIILLILYNIYENTIFNKKLAI